MATEARTPSWNVDSNEVNEPQAQSSPSKTPPRWWVVVADWCNLLGGFTLIGAFVVGAKLNNGSLELSASNLKWLEVLFTVEGVFFAVGELFMIGIMARTPDEFGGGARGCIQFAFIMTGGILFAFSGLVFPGCITNLTYLFNSEECAHPAASGPYVWNGMGHFGITVFMISTAIGFTGIVRAPKNKLVSPFWGVTFFSTGCWIIGIFKFWLPTLLGGFDTHQNDRGFDFDAPMLAWTSLWWIGLVGAIFLTAGAIVFCFMNGSFGIRV